MSTHGSGRIPVPNIDHIEIGRRLGLFMVDPLVGQGLPLFAPPGAKILQVLQRFIEDEEERRGYQITQTPVMAKSDLYKVSGHWDLYKEHMFVVDQEEELALRPMTCPFQFLIYKSALRSYRDLPIRYSETSKLFRNEFSGSMHGLIRMRQFTLADGHIICRLDQIEQEFNAALELAEFVMSAIGFGEVWCRLSKWDPQRKDKFIDNPEAWTRSEACLREVLQRRSVAFVEAVGEAAFYGPKLDIQTRNVYGKEDTVVTIQLDFALADRFDLSYTDASGNRARPVIIHRSSIGCYERTLAYLLELTQGRLPFWLSPVQLAVLTVSEKFSDFGAKVVDALREVGCRCELDGGADKLGRKILGARERLVPVAAIVGQKEAEAQTISLRYLDGGEVAGVAVDRFVHEVKMAVGRRDLRFSLSDGVGSLPCAQRAD